MYPILARLGPYFIYSYTVVMILAVGAGMLLMALLNARTAKPTEGWFDGALLAFAAALVGGRIVFVWANWSYYQENTNEIVQVWQGGLSYHGALAAGLAALLAWCWISGCSKGSILALLLPSIALASALGWTACWLDGCAYGREALPGILVGDLPDSFGVFALRYRTQLLGVLVSLLALVVALFLWRSKSFDILPWLTLLILASGRLVITLFRGDNVPLFNTVRLDTIAEAIIVASCALALTIAAGRRRGHFGTKQPL